MRDYTESDLIVETSSGQMQGFLDRGMPNWRGVPYARAEQRFRPPAPVKSASPIIANRWGTVSWQLPIELGKTSYRVPMDNLVEDEDCLNLNVWSPGPRQEGPLPVLVWFHGGNRVSGSGSTWIDPWHFAARHGAVAVTANYRLGLWGWLYLGGHDQAFGDSANLGLLDQVMLLRWIKDNIAGFGGDPANVTLFGMSSGGSDVATLLGTPSAQGLFHKAVIYSGNAEAPVPEDDAVRFTEEFIAAAGSLANSPDDLTRLPNVGLRHVHGKLLERGVTVRYGPFVDGTIVPKPPLDTISGGLIADVPVLVSVTSDEAGLYAGFGKEMVDRTYDRLAGGDPSVEQEEKIRIISQKYYWEPANRLLQAAHHSGGSVWMQKFCYAPTNSHFALTHPSLAARPVHGTDIASLFIDTEGNDGTETDRLVGARVQNALIAMARDGRPPWKQWTPEEPVTHRIVAPDSYGAIALR
jgi:para-nitrobenzyl esterase